MIQYKVRDIETGKTFYWTVKEILKEINKDRSEDWTDYDESDWEEGWDEWIDTYLIVGEVKNNG